MPKRLDFRNSLDDWVPLFIILMGFFHAIVETILLNVAFSDEFAWYEFLKNIVALPQFVFWIVIILYLIDLGAIILGFLILYGRSVASRQEKEN